MYLHRHKVVQEMSVRRTSVPSCTGTSQCCLSCAPAERKRHPEGNREYSAVGGARRRRTAREECDRNSKPRVMKSTFSPFFVQSPLSKNKYGGMDRVAD